MDRMTNGTASMNDARLGQGPSQLLRKGIIALCVLFALLFLFVAESHWPSGTFMHEGIEWLGFVLIVICILGRTWCTLFIGGRKNEALVEGGPYSVSRNPLYAFSIVGAAGVGAQFGSITTALVAGFFVWGVFLWTVWREEASLLVTFGDQYRRYLDTVPRFWPDLSRWSSPQTVTVQPRMIAKTFFDALVFLAAIPITEGFEYLHSIKALPLLFTVP